MILLIQLTKTTLSTQNTVESSMNPSDNIDIITTINIIVSVLCHASGSETALLTAVLTALLPSAFSNV